MADWSDIVGKTLTQARQHADRYDHDVSVIQIGESYEQPAGQHERPSVLVGVNESGNQAIVVRQFGVEGPQVLPAPGNS